MEDGKLDKPDEKMKLEARRARASAGRQRKILTEGASNAEYHHHGSAKVPGGIGQGFAESVLELMAKAD